MKEKFHRAQRGGGEDHRAAGEPPGLALDPRRGLDGAHLVSGAAIACAIERPDVHNFGFRKHLRPVFFSEVKVVKVECVFRAVAAAHHAAAASDACRSLGTVSPEERIGEGLTNRSISSLEDAHLRAVKRMLDPGSFRRSLQKMVGRSKDFVFRNP